MKPWLVAHRGAPHHAQENTVEAFRIARDFNVGYIEFDVRVTGDNIPIIHHDPNILGRDIASSTLAELRALDTNLTTLEEALHICENMPLIIELKSKGSAQHTAPYLVNNPQSSATSFYVHELEQLAELGVPKARIFLAQRYHAIGLRSKALQHKFGGISINAWYLSPWFYIQSTKSNLRILAYTVNSTIWAKVMRKWYPSVLICTNRPDKLRKLD